MNISKFSFSSCCLFVSVLLSTIILNSCTVNSSQSNQSILHSNPLTVAFGDPFILSASDGKYYMYGTGGVEKGFAAYSSDNLVDWHFEGEVYSGNQPNSWTVKNYWAPEVYEFDGEYYMFFSADWKENPQSYNIRKTKVTSKSKLKQRLAPGGGAAMRITPLPSAKK